MSQAIAHYKSKGWSFFKSEWNTPFGELDLVFQKASTLLIVEVKAVESIEFLERYFQSGQFERQKRILSWLNEFKHDVEFELFVLENGKHEFQFSDFEW